eukprot:284411-Prymnesium_polylepis.1
MAGSSTSPGECLAGVSTARAIAGARDGRGVDTEQRQRQSASGGWAADAGPTAAECAGPARSVRFRPYHQPRGVVWLSRHGHLSHLRGLRGTPVPSACRTRRRDER